MTRQPGRAPGRQVVTDGVLRDRYLAAVAAGMRLGAAATHVGVGVNFARRQRTTPGFAAALQDAQAVGKKLRDDDMPHDEYRYINQGCRCSTCRNASRVARAGRRAAADPGGEVVDMPPPPVATATFPLLRAC